MRLLLDTHVLVHWDLDDPSIASGAFTLIDTALEEQGSVSCSIISLWEVAKLVELKRLSPRLSVDEWLADLEDHPQLEILPITARIAVESTRLGPSFPRDPADQLIAATARCHGLHLLTSDGAIRKSGVVALAE
ncbi:MAG: type II toxin-antitoxin system VapC family toxin [Acidobacteriota bacterium]